MPQRFLRNATAKVGEVFQMAIMELANMRKGELVADFILMALVEQKDSIVLKIFDELRVDTAQIRRKLVDGVMAGAQTLEAINPRTPGRNKND